MEKGKCSDFLPFPFCLFPSGCAPQQPARALAHFSRASSCSALREDHEGTKVTKPTATYQYRDRVLAELARHGLRPLSRTRPERLRDAVLDLYKYEIHVLKRRLLAGGIERRDYARHVIELRRRYPLLSVPLHQWTVRAGER